jgi:hypothetical protein
MRILIPLFSPATGTWGGLTRVIDIAKEGKEDGHEVAFCASGRLETELRQHGYPVYSMPGPTLLGLPEPISQRIEQRSQRTSLPIRPGKSFGNIWLVLVFSGLGRASYLKRLVEAQIAAVRDLQPDTLFTDLDPGAGLLSAISGLPLSISYACIETEGYGSWPWRLMNRAINPVLRAYGNTESTIDELLFNPLVLKIIPSIPELDGTNPSRSDVRYVGHLLGEIQPLPRAASGAEIHPQTGQRKVFVYMGTGSVSLDRLRRILPQVFPSEGGLTCMVAAQSIHRRVKIGGVEFLPYVPAAEILPSCAWTICHGGQNTIVQSLLNGVPLMVFPGPIFERRFNARRVQELGAGRMGELNEFTAHWLRTALEGQAACAVRAESLGERFRNYGGAAAAIQAIETHWRTLKCG